MKRQSILLVTLVFVLKAVLATASEGKPGANWDVSDIGVGQRYIAHGQKVHGHEFGFVKKYGYCDYDILWVNLSTYDNAIHKHKGEQVELKISSGDAEYIVRTSLLTTNEFGSLLKIATFSNAILDAKLWKLLVNAKHITLAVESPSWVAELFDIGEEEFDLTRLRATRVLATEKCEKADPEQV